MESTPGAFPLFIALMAFLTSASVGGRVSMLRSSGTGGGSAGSSGCGWFRTSQKYSTHLSACSRSVVIVQPSLPFTGAETRWWCGLNEQLQHEIR